MRDIRMSEKESKRIAGVHVGRETIASMNHRHIASTCDHKKARHPQLKGRAEKFVVTQTLDYFFFVPKLTNRTPFLSGTEYPPLGVRYFLTVLKSGSFE